MTMMKCLGLSFLLVAASVQGFSPSVVTVSSSVSRPFGIVTASSSTRRFVASQLPADDECLVDPPTTPSSVFGTPLDEGTKVRNKQLIHGIKSILFDNLFIGSSVSREFARFYALETIARMPYFSYVSCLHLLETLGLWRKADYLKVHFAESWNELHHLLIMEELGGNEEWRDRFVAQHVAVFYFWMVFGFYLVNPTFAYNLNQAVEEEAFETYSKFLKDNEDYLKSKPPAQAAIDYYTGDDLYMFDKMHFDGQPKTEVTEPVRRPVIETLYDVFCAVRDDEAEHVKTMAFMQEHVRECGPM